MKVRLKKPYVVCCSDDLICLDSVEIACEHNTLSFDWSENTISWIKWKMWALLQKACFSTLPSYLPSKHWHELYINLREWIFFVLCFFFLFSLNRLVLWHIGSVRNERYSCRHAILVMKSPLDLLHDWVCNLLFSGSQNEMMSRWTNFRYP